MSFSRFLTVVYLLNVGQLHAADDNQLPGGYKLVRLRNGVNNVDLDGDGKKDVVMVGHRENYNAHSFDVTTVFIWTKALDAKGKAELQVVPWQHDAKGLEDSRSPFPLELTTSGGADGLLHDFRLFIDPAKHSAALIVAEREFGESFADSRPVTFRYYRLARNQEQTPGEPTVYFATWKDFTSKKSYPGVTTAFQEELGLLGDGRWAGFED